jgi:sensory rhodopsin
MELLVLATQYLFWVGFVGMAAGTLYFLVERDSLPEKYKSTATVAALVTFVAAIHYHAMKHYVGTDGSIDSLLTFPTEIRYIDWLVTTPLLLVKFPTILRLPKAESGSLLTKLVLADIIMIVTGYVGETSINNAGAATATGWIMFIVSMLAWLYIVGILFGKVTEAANNEPEEIKQGLLSMRTFVLVGWAVYPIGYLVTLVISGDGAEMAIVLREFIYNIADLINKVGFGLVAILAIKAATNANKA